MKTSTRSCNPRLNGAVSIFTRWVVEITHLTGPGGCAIVRSSLPDPTPARRKARAQHGPSPLFSILCCGEIDAVRALPSNGDIMYPSLSKHEMWFRVPVRGLWGISGSLPEKSLFQGGYGNPWQHKEFFMEM